MKKQFFTIIIISLLLTGCTLTSTPNSNDTNSSPTKNIVINKTNKLDLSSQNLSKVPDNTFTQTDLQELNVSNNKLTGSLQAEIRHLQNLRILNMSNNQLSGVPAEVGQLSKLEILNLSNNQLTGLPQELGNLKNLKTLNISGNNYSVQDLEIIKKGLASDVNIIK